MIIFGKMLTCFQIENNYNTFIVSIHGYGFNDKAPVISLWIQSGCGQIALTLWSNHTGCAIWLPQFAALSGTSMPQLLPPPPKWCNCAYGFCTHESLLTKF